MPATETEEAAKEPPTVNAHKMPIDLRRASAGSMTVGLPNEGNIKELFKIGEQRLLIVKEYATYDVKMADMIDPERTNEYIPNVQQRVFSSGTSSELLQKVLLTSRKMFDPTFLPHVDVSSVSQNAVNAMGELLAMERLFERVMVEEEKLISDLKDEKLENGFIIPTLEDTHQNVKNFLQRADHFIREINLITRQFEKGFGNWDGLIKRAEREKPPNDLYIQFLKKAVPYIQFVREARNAVEHPLPSKRVEVTNFELDRAGVIVVPSIEVVHPRFPEPKTRLLAFLDGTIQSLANFYAEWIAHLCARKATFGDFGVSVAMLPKERRAYPGLAYSYGIMHQGDWQPIG